jgi:integrase
MTTTFDVRVWKVGKARSKTAPHMVRWVVAGKVKTETFTAYALADSFRSELLSGLRRGEAFDVDTGRPLSMLRQQAQEEPEPDPLSWLDFCREYVAMRWDGAAAKTRDAITDSLATTTLALVERGAGRPSDSDLRIAFRWAMVPANHGAEPTKVMAPALGWLTKGCPPVASLSDPKTMRRVVDQLGLTLTGKQAAGDTMRRRRRGLNPALEYAVEAGYLDVNPLTRVKRKHVASTDQVDPRVLVNPRQARELLTALSYVGGYGRARGRRLVGFFATLYYAGPRPAEALGLTADQCDLPGKGWGVLTFGPTLPVAGKQWTNTGDRHDRRGLKQRDPDAERPVPIPPELVRILTEHIDTFGLADDGRLFFNERRGILGSTTYSRAWEEARHLALTPIQAASPLAGRPYDLRHAALTTWLNAGVPPAEVAKRAGNSVEVLLKRYAGCIDGQQDAINKRIEDQLGNGDAA